MFNDKYGLTQAVIEKRKTMTRRIVNDCHPKYQIGENLAVAQSYHNLNKLGFTAPEWLDHTCESSAGYDNKMFVRADLMPYGIRITDIKMERLQDITDEDARCEGVEPWLDHSYIVPGIMDGGGQYNKCFETPRLAFAALIDKVVGKGTWDDNPWVYAYKFELFEF